MKTDDPFYEKLFLLALSETLRRDGVARAWVNARRIADAFYREHLNEGPSAGLLGDPEGPRQTYTREEFERDRFGETGDRLAAGVSPEPDQEPG